MAAIGRRFRRHHTRTKMHPAAIVAICLAVAVVLTVLVGNLLKIRLDEADYQRLTVGEPERQPLPEGEVKVRRINAYPYTFGDAVEGAGGYPAISVHINDPADGKMAYTSDMTAYLGLLDNENVRLHETFVELSVFASYVSGVFYPQAFRQTIPDLVYAKGAEEAALLREFSRAGGSEVVLCGLPLDESNINAVCEYISLVSHALGDTPVGVAIPVNHPELREGWESLARLERVCDFFVLDLRDVSFPTDDLDEIGASATAEAFLQANAYPITAYSMRLMLDAGQSGLLSTLEARLYPNYQVVAK